MLKKGYLANNSVYVSVMHTKKIINKYILILDECFRKIKKCEEKKFNINKLLKSPVNMQGFVRLN